MLHPDILQLHLISFFLFLFIKSVLTHQFLLQSFSTTFVCVVEHRKRREIHMIIIDFRFLCLSFKTFGNKRLRFNDVLQLRSFCIRIFIIFRETLFCRLVGSRVIRVRLVLPRFRQRLTLFRRYSLLFDKGDFILFCFFLVFCYLAVLFAV